jgi:hypothetical protein
MAKKYFITIEDPEQFEDAVNHLAKGKFFEETDMRKDDNDTVVTSSIGAYDGALMYLAYKGIDFVNFESP